MDITELHDYFFDTLKALDSYCRENDIQYQIMWGTLLGAARHCDFIPWDDDVDVILNRDNYDKFCKLAKKIPEGYRLVMPGDEGVFYDFMPRFVNTNIVVDRHDFDIASDIPKHIFNPGIDVYVIEPSYTGFRHKLHWCHKMILYGLARGHRPFEKEISYAGKSGILLKLSGKILQVIGKHMDIQKIANRFDNISRKCNNSKGMVFNSNGEPIGITAQFESKWFETSVPLMIRDSKFPAPVGYKELLTAIYGDYTKYPDESKRKPYHYNVVYNPANFDPENVNIDE